MVAGRNSTSDPTLVTPASTCFTIKGRKTMTCWLVADRRGWTECILLNQWPLRINHAIGTEIDRALNVEPAWARFVVTPAIITMQRVTANVARAGRWSGSRSRSAIGNAAPTRRFRRECSGRPRCRPASSGPGARSRGWERRSGPCAGPCRRARCGR